LPKSPTLTGQGHEQLSPGQLDIDVCHSIGEISAADWDSCACPESGTHPVDPFTTHRFLKALEDSGSVSPRSGWQPVHVMARNDGIPIAAMPLYAKYHSQGEYVFDHAWAHAFEQAGGSYYPKLQSSVPFTPATGRRFLTRQGHEHDGRQALLGCGLSLLEGNRLSSLHVTFCTGEEAEYGREHGLLKRTGEQFHWVNRGYRDFTDFLDGMTSRKRRNIKKERRTAMKCDGTIECLTGSRIRDEHWSAFWEFYLDTGSRKWGSTYLTRRFFDEIGSTMAGDVMLVMCRRAGRYIAGALNFIGKDTLYGRYWGCIENHSCLHFEVCYYQAIEFAIRHGLGKIEAGAQGPHKIARGYMPVQTHSLHWIGNPSFRNAVREFLKDESSLVLDDIELLESMGPYKEMT